jgi:hypothetical protein
MYFFICWNDFPKEPLMGDDLDELLEAAKKAEISVAQQEEQRRSFAYGNTKIENPRITRQTIDDEADLLKRNAE